MLPVEQPPIGPYMPVRLLGEGSTTYTYLYRHEQRKRYAVLKIGYAPLATTEAKGEFAAYAKQLKKLIHRNIVAVQDFGLHPPAASEQHYGYLILQYIESAPITRRFPAGKQARPDEIRRVLLPLTDALQYASANHIVHGNLHPGNVLQTEKDVFLTDFFLPALSQESSARSESKALLYRAPEHLRGQAGAASDQYALAVMAYEWLCGRRPYLATTREELLKQQESEPIPAPSSLNPDISPLVERVLLQALSLDPRERFPHPQTFSDSYLHALMGRMPMPQISSVPAPTLVPAPASASSAPQPAASQVQTVEEKAPVAVTTRKSKKAAAREAAAAVQAPVSDTPAASRSVAEQVLTVEPVRERASLSLVRERQSASESSSAPEPPAKPERASLSYEMISDLQRRVEQDLRQGGVLSLALPGYEERPAQIEMASMVARSISDNTPAIIEASTGTGKSLAYLISVVRSGKVAIVSTANKALQEQLFFKDIPFIQKHIRRIDAALVKGMGNYICLDRVEQERVGFQHYVRNPDFMHLVERIEESDERFTGDFEMLGFTLKPEIRSKVNADRDQCTWSKCSYFSDCYVHKMKTRAAQASVIVVNHTLLLLDAFMEGKLLPERDVIIVDEAHHLEEEATRAFTTTISPGQVATLLAQGLLKNHTPLSMQDETRETMNLAWEQLARVADPGSKGRANLKEPLQEGLGLASMVEKLADALRTGRPKDMDEKDEQLYDKLITRAQNLAGDIRLVFSVNQPEKYVYYVEGVKTGRRSENKQLEVSAAPLEVTNWLREQLFDKSNVICTSATLATIGPDPARPEVKGPNFAYFRRRAGLDHNNYPDVQERILPLTFDYEGHALLYLPRHIPEPAYGDGPAEQEYTKAIAREMIKLVEASRGRAFLLFSSRRMLDKVFDIFMSELPSNLKFPLLRQGDMTRLDLVRSFREREGAVLFGLKSFWEGVDIAGEALSLVVIDKLPFDPPDDPVHEARVAQMKAAGENWFGIYVLPQTVLRLKQGLGRLLRTHSDRGVMAILDTRLYTKSYGKQIVQALPPARRAFNMETVIRFFQNPDDDDDAPF
ncbi:MAG TPA: helicase C-terminal domain-containing protein [Ktedonobacteraceae bacterium]